MSDRDETASNSEATEDDLQVYVDGADRLERSLDVQLQRIENLDSRAGFITRLVAVLLGVVVSTTSILVSVSTNVNDAILPLNYVPGIAAILATLGLVGSMVMGIIAYLSSNQLPGLGQPTAAVLSHPDYRPEMEAHLKNTIGAYETAMAHNERVLQTNADRLRLTLTLLIVGIVYWTVTAASLVAGPGGTSGLLLLSSTLFLAGVTLYIMTKTYIVPPPQEEDNE